MSCKLYYYGEASNIKIYFVYIFRKLRRFDFNVLYFGISPYLLRILSRKKMSSQIS